MPLPSRLTVGVFLGHFVLYRRRGGPRRHPWFSEPEPSSRGVSQTVGLSQISITYDRPGRKWAEDLGWAGSLRHCLAGGRQRQHRSQLHLSGHDRWEGAGRPGITECT